jgi:hypothetical protein
MKRHGDAGQLPALKGSRGATITHARRLLLMTVGRVEPLAMRGPNRASDGGSTERRLVHRINSRTTTAH